MANPISKLSLVINGVTTQLDVHDANALTTEIDSMGTDWVRFKCGIQICYGTVRNNNNISTGVARYSFPIAFISLPALVVTPSVEGIWIMTSKVEGATTWVLNVLAAWLSPITYSDLLADAAYVAIGKWK